MEHDKKKQEHRFRTLFHSLLLFVEIISVSVFLWGQRTSQTSVVTPEFSWDHYETIAHALGGIGDKTYLNSKESFLAAYQMGCRLFEVDLTRTADGVWVCRHSWKQSLGQWDGEEAKVLSSEEFLASPIYGKYTPLTFEDLMLLLKEYPDAFVMLDSKQYSLRNYQTTLDDYVDYLDMAREAGAEDAIDQIIPEIYNQAMFAGTALLYQFPAYIYSLWKEYSEEELGEIAEFCQEKGIGAATLYYKYWSEDVQKIFDENNIKLYIYTVNDLDAAREYRKKGAAGICSDYLLDTDLDFDKKGIKINYEN